MLTKIMFRTCTIMLLFNLIACAPDDSVAPKLDTEAPLTIYDVEDSKPPISEIPVPSSPFLSVEIMASSCTVEGVNLMATNPSQIGNPPYSQSFYSVKWYKNDQLIGTGAELSGCICGEKVVVKVENTTTGAKGTSTYIAKPCKSQTSLEEF